MADFITSRLIDSVLACDLPTKRKLGQRLARHLRLQEGDSGSDDGIDGIAEWEGELILFQSKLEDRPLGPDKAKIFVADIFRHGARRGIYLAGRGYTDGFKIVASKLQQRLSALGCEITLYLICLQDVFDNTEEMRQAASVLPPLTSIGFELPAESSTHENHLAN